MKEAGKMWVSSGDLNEIDIDNTEMSSVKGQVESEVR